MLPIVFFGGVFAHEWGHLLAGSFYGETGAIVFTFSSGGMVERDLGVVSPWPVYFAGGGFAALFTFLGFWLVPFLTPTINDLYLELAAILVALAQLLYAWYEVGVQGQTWWYIPFCLTLLLLPAILYLYRGKLVKWYGGVNNG